MIVLEIGNSISRLRGLPTGPFNRLRALLSYQIDPYTSYYGGGHKPRRQYLIDVKGVFPSGVLSRVTEFLAKESIQFETADSRKIPRNKQLFKPKFKHRPYVDQITASNNAVNEHRGILSLPTGTGKSLLTQLIVANFGAPALIVVPTLELKRQLTEDCTAVFGTTAMKHITIENIDSSALDEPGDYDVLIIDEAHHAASKRYQQLNRKVWGGIYYRFFLTATPFRTNSEENLLFEGIAGKVIYRLFYAEAVKKGYIVPVESFYVKLNKKPTDSYTWREVYSELVVNNEERNVAIAEMAASLESAKCPTLILVKEVKHGKLIADLCGMPFAHAEGDNCRQYIQAFNDGKITVLIGTEGILGEGVDTRPCEYVIVAGLGKAKGAFMQKIGRGVRQYGMKKSAKVVLFRDSSHRFLLRHFNEQRKILKEEYGIVPTLIDRG